MLLLYSFIKYSSDVNFLNTSLKMSDILGVSDYDGRPDDFEIIGVNNGQNFSYTISFDATLGETLDVLKGYGINAYVQDGKLTLAGNKNSYITSIGDPRWKIRLRIEGEGSWWSSIHSGEHDSNFIVSDSEMNSTKVVSEQNEINERIKRSKKRKTAS